MNIVMRTLPFWIVCGLVACGSDPKPPPAAPAGDTAAPTAAAEPAAPSEKPGDDPSKSQIRIDDAIKKACGITDAEAYFGFDSSNIQQRDHDVLGKLAKCFIDGPLAGRTMRLVGHADPRGEEEYNMVLGGKRADSVKGFLVQKQLPEKQVETTSRGEMDATGTDEASWAEDRRVDIVLAD
jgi:peptidoglycan-associated lipoprotein